MRKKIFFLLIIVLLGGILRFNQLGSVPNSLEWDEVSYGYNAYSVLQTGKDEYGVVHPLFFKAFGEYKQPVYVYFDVLSIKLFGLDSFAVRFPSALFGTLGIIGVFLLLFELFYKYKEKEKLAFLSAFLFAISPWSIQFSRAAFEANVGVTLIIFGSYLFLSAVRKNNLFLMFLSLFIFSLSMYTYLSDKLFVPLILISLTVYSYKYFMKRKIILILMIFLVLVLNSLWIFNSSNTLRSQSVLFTNSSTQILSSSLPKLYQAKKDNNLIGEVIYNRRVVYGEYLIGNYFSHFNPNWLFLKGENIARHHPYGMGNLLLVSFPFILLGIYFGFRFKPAIYFVLAWLLFAPIPSALTNEVPHSLRSLIFLPTFQILEALGLLAFFSFLQKRVKLEFLIVIVIVAYLLNYTLYLNQYYRYTNLLTGDAWQYGYAQAVEYTNSNFKNKKIYFASDISQAYIFYLFYTKYDPNKYLLNGGTNIQKYDCYSIENTYYGKCITSLSTGDIIVTQGKSYQNTKKIYQINYLDGKEAVLILKKL